MPPLSSLGNTNPFVDSTKNISTIMAIQGYGYTLQIIYACFMEVKRPPQRSLNFEHIIFCNAVG